MYQTWGTARLRKQRASTCENCKETTESIKLLWKFLRNIIDIQRAATVPAEQGQSRPTWCELTSACFSGGVRRFCQSGLLACVDPSSSLIACDDATC